MKSFLALFSFSIVYLLAACNKSSDTISENGTLTGRWKLIEKNYSDGSPNSVWVPVDSSGLYAQFNLDSSFNTNLRNDVIYSGIRKYSIINDMRIIFFDSIPRQFERGYTLQNDTLILEGGCTEECALKFIK